LESAHELKQVNHMLSISLFFTEVQIPQPSIERKGATKGLYA